MMRGSTAGRARKEAQRHKRKRIVSKIKRERSRGPRKLRRQGKEARKDKSNDRRERQNEKRKEERANETPQEREDRRERQNEKQKEKSKEERQILVDRMSGGVRDEGSRHTSRTRGRTMSSSFTFLNALPIIMVATKKTSKPWEPSPYYSRCNAPLPDRVYVARSLPPRARCAEAARGESSRRHARASRAA